MSWSRTAPALAITLALFGLAGCGFKPLYGNHASAVSQQALDQVRIGPLSDRVGQLLHIQLSKAMHPKGKPRNAVWVLQIQLSESTENLGIRKDETATRANYILRARFQLRRIQARKAEFSGRAVITNSYNILESRFGTVAATGDAQRRATRELAENIKTRVALFFALGDRRR